MRRPFFRWDERLIRTGYDLTDVDTDNHEKVIQCNKFLGGLFGVWFVLHKFTGADDCFHTHQAPWGIRIILWGGYSEELWSPNGPPYKVRKWWPGMIGLIQAHYAHKILAPHNGKCAYSLWIRPETKYAAVIMRPGEQSMLINGDGSMSRYTGPGWGNPEPVFGEDTQ